MEIKEINVNERVAMSFLKNNPRNRPLSKSRSLKYAKQMTEGNWQQNGESIIIGWDGSILDGQHRLEGVVLAKTSIKLLFVFGVDPATFPTIDTGTGRSGADTLAIYGVDPFIAKSLSAAIKKDILMSYTGGIILHLKMQKQPQEPYCLHTGIIKNILKPQNISILLDGKIYLYLPPT